MPPKRLFWITSERHPRGYVHETAVFTGLRARGIEVLPTVWDRDPIPVLGAGDIVVVRTPWDYLAKFSRFLDFLDRLPKGRVHNSTAILRWNAKKDYLRELEAAGVRIVPTRWMNAGSDAEVAREISSAFAGRRKIIKPVLSAGSVDTYLLAPEELPLDGVFVDRPAMVQPFLEEIETDGERSLVFFSGDLSHGIRKRPRPGDFRVQESHGGRMSRFDPTGEEIRFGDSVLAAIRARFPNEPAPLYARIDYVLARGSPYLMEAELLEPDLYFHHAPDASADFVSAIARLPE